MKMFFRVLLSRSMCVLVCLSCCVQPNLSGFNYIQIIGETFSECSRWNDDALSCFTFDLTVVNREIQAVKLLFNKYENISNANTSELILFDLGPLDGFEQCIGEKRVISREMVKTNATVVQIVLTDVVKIWTTSADHTRIMGFKYNNSESVFNVSNGNRPSLAVIYSAAQRLRRQASVDGECDARYYCCVIDKVIRFNIMEMPSVVYPDAMNIRRCNDICTDLLAPNTTNALFWVRYLTSADVSTRAIALASLGAQICCAPRAYDPASILFFNEGRFQVDLLEEMVVTRCGCI